MRRKLRCSGPPCRPRSIPALTAGKGGQRRHGAGPLEVRCHCPLSSAVKPRAQNICTQNNAEASPQCWERRRERTGASRGSQTSGRGAPPSSPARTARLQDTLQQPPQFSPRPRSPPDPGPGSALTMAAAGGTSVSGQRMADPARGRRNLARAVLQGDAPPSNATLRPSNGGGASETGGERDRDREGTPGRNGGHREDRAGRKRRCEGTGRRGSSGRTGGTNPVPGTGSSLPRALRCDQGCPRSWGAPAQLPHPPVPAAPPVPVCPPALPGPLRALSCSPPRCLPPLGSAHPGVPAPAAAGRTVRAAGWHRARPAPDRHRHRHRHQPRPMAAPTAVATAGESGGEARTGTPITVEPGRAPRGGQGECRAGVPRGEVHGGALGCKGGPAGVPG